MTNFGKLELSRKTGNEEFHSSGQSLGFKTLDFWRWATSDLVSNATRGRLAEFIVGEALGLATGVRNEWDAFDLQTLSGLKIEVKSAAYLQSWNQKELSKISFRVQKTLAWDADTNLQDKEYKRQADVYIFALLAHQEKPTLDPLNVDQWCFYVLETKVLNERQRSQHSITLKSLENLVHPVSFHELKAAVAKFEN